MAKRKSNPLVAALFGILMVPGSVALQAWNEYRTVHRTRGLLEAEADVQSIRDPFTVQSELEGKLVHLTGEAVTNETLRDPVFGVEQIGITMRRRVEMYQWEEDKHQDDGKTTYRYTKGWHEGRINSESFSQSSSHHNPMPSFSSWKATAAHVMVGEYELSGNLKSQKNDYIQVQLDLANIKGHLDAEAAAIITIQNSQLYFPAGGGTLGAPDVGDTRILFDLVPTGPIGLMARLQGNSFGEYKTSNGEPIEKLYPGTLSAAEVIAKLKLENLTLAWVLRGVGFVICLIGITLIFAPAQALFRWIPLVGNITGGLILVVSGITAVVLSLLTISISWIAVRPMLAAVLFLVALGLLYLLFRTGRRAQHPHVPPHADDQATMLTEDMVVH
jgi:hypothetical protein